MTTDPPVESEPTEPIGPSVSEKVAKPKTGASLRPLPFLFAFVIAAVVFLALGTAVALGMSRMYDGRILPSVHVGSVDLSGLNRGQAISKLTAEYGYLSDGQVTVQTPVGAAKITYKEIGRGPDAAAMADAALQVGRQGDPIANAAAAVRAVATGDNVPLMVKDDPAIAASILAELSKPAAAMDFRTGGTFVELQPHVSVAQAQDAIVQAQKMAADLP